MITLFQRLLVGLLGCCMFSVAFAQEDSADSGLALEEVIVTAQKREESMQDIAITIQSYTGVQVADAGIQSTDSLSQIIPGFQATRQIGGSIPYMRGIGTQNGAMGDEASIPQYIDGVYMASTYSTVTYFNNIARIEVLKGPQGTLYGRNATGGLVNIVTMDPSHEKSGQIGVSYGNYDTVNANLYATGGIGEYVAADIAVTYLNQGDGYGTNLYTGEDVNEMDNTSIRSKWLITPNDKLGITFIADYGDFAGSVALARTFVPGTYGADGAVYYAGCLAGGGTPEACVAFAQANATTQDGFQNNSANWLNFSGTRQWGLSARVDYAFDGLDFVSISAYRDANIRTFLDQDATPFPFVNATLPKEEKQFSQEFQLLSNNDSALSWILGLYYLDFKPAYTPFELAGALGGGVTGLLLPVTQYTKSYAVFGEASYAFNDQWSLTVGGRYTWDKRTIDGQTTLMFGPTVVALPPFHDSTKWDEPTWKVALDYQATDDVMIYGSYSRGYKSGVYNSVVTNGQLAPPVDPEILDAYELGFKSFLADGRVRLNGAAFYYDYKNMQLTNIDAGVTRIRNAASSEVLGAEMEMGFAVTENLELNAGVAFLESEYKKFDGCAITTPRPIGGGQGQPPPTSCAGNDLIRAPDWTGNIGANYSIPVTSGTIKASFNWYFNNGFYWEPDNNYKESAYNVLNAEVSWTNADETIRVRLFGANLTDSEYSWYSNTGGLGFQTSAAPPLTWGAGFDFYW